MMAKSKSIKNTNDGWTLRPIGDWTKPECYPNPKNASPHRWAYEFLRRNHDYQKDYLACKRAYDDFVPGKLSSLRNGKPATDPGVSLEDVMALQQPQAFDPPRIPGETLLEWKRRVGSWKIVSLAQSYSSKWGLRSRPFDPFEDLERSFNPEIASPRNNSEDDWWWTEFGLESRFKSFDDYLIEFIRFETAYNTWIVGPLWDGFNKPYHDVFSIDYRFPLKAQIEVIRKLATNRRDELSKINDLDVKPTTKTQRGDLYRQYLQCLDAVDCGVSPHEIAEKLLPGGAGVYPGFTGSNRITKQIKTAEDLRHEKYRLLLI